MRRQRLRLLIASALVVLSACGRTVPLRLPDATPVQVVFLGEDHPYTLTPSSKEYLYLTPSSKEYHQLRLWLEHNQSGWSPYLATTPSRGILVTGENLWLQFIGSSAITRTAKGTFTKSVASSDYAFLRR
jgi:predicted small lipoprotein YifL